jgi:hypothetical protein
MNPTIPKNIINDEQSGPYEPTKGVKAHLPLDCLCGPFRSPLVTFLGVVGFVSLKSLQRYQLCHHQSFDVILMFFFFYFALSSLVIKCCVYQICNLKEYMIFVTRELQISSTIL